jgi:rSAM/selenodomain-associated transferase 2
VAPSAAVAEPAGADIAVIVPVLDEAALIEPALAALGRLRAEDPGVEIIVVDGGSRDGSVARALAAGFRVVASAPGRGTQMDAGAAATSARVLLFLHADTRLPEGALSLVRAAIDSGADAGWFELRYQSDRALLGAVGRLASWRSHLTRIAGGDQGIFVTRAAFEAVGGYGDTPIFEDLDLCRRLRSRFRLVQVGAAVTSSPRRWQRDGLVRTALRLGALRLAWHLRLPRHAARARYPDLRASR